MSLGFAAGLPESSDATAAAQTFACEFAAKADLGIAPAIAASPMTWMFGWSFDSKVDGSIGHQPLRSATPAASAMRPAFCGGMTLATAALCCAKSVTSVLVAGSTEVTLPPLDSGTHSTMPG